jgi:transcription elongation factor GreA
MTKQILLTDEGLKNLTEELDYLTSVKRLEIAEKIKVALSFGDLSENSEYDEAKNEQAIAEARILEIQTLLKNAKILDEDDINTENIHIGAKIKVKDFEFDEIVNYQIVGSTEADPMYNKISDESPVGKALLGHSVGDVVVVETPDGEISFEVLEISK